MVQICGHCGKRRILTARVSSDILDQIVCNQCAILALRLATNGDDVEGALTVVPLCDDAYTFQLALN